MPSCESGYTYPEPNNHRFVWGTCYAAHVATFDEINNQRRSVSPWWHTLDSDPVGLKYRCHWSPPLAINWFDNSVYFGCQKILRTRDRGQTWQEISPDLSTADPSRIRYSGGVVGDNLGQFYGAVVSAIAPSRTERDVIWAGTNDGKVWITRNGGTNWTDLTANVRFPLPWGVVRRIDASHHDAATAYMAVDYHLVDHREPYLFKTSDYGATWSRIDGNLPRNHPLDYTMAIAENPARRGMLFAGTGHGFYYTLDDGRTWTQFKDKLPAVVVTWIEVPKNAAEVAVATYGRGLWVLRDLWQLEQADVGAADELRLLRPRPGVRTATGGTANFVFELKQAATTPIQVEVLGANNAVLGSWQVQGRLGLNQTSWDLQLPGQARPTLRSIPADNPHIWEAGRWQTRERPVTHWGLAAGMRPRAAPGRYTVRMTYNGKSYTQPFEIWKDASLTTATAEDLVAGTDLQVKVVTAINEVVDRINRIEIMRQQVEDLRKQHASNRQLDNALNELYQKMYNTELHYLSRTEMHSDDKWYVEKYKLYMNLVWLAAEIGGSGGDVMGGYAYRPTAAAVSNYNDQMQLKATADADFQRLMQEVEAFNRTHQGRLPAITDRLRGPAT
jgi:hypothetical protein